VADVPASADVVDAVLTASRTLVAVAEQSLGAAAEETTLAQYRALVVLASRGPQRMVDLARALQVTPPTAGRMCDRLVRKGLIRRHRARADRREVQVSITAAGRQVVDDATERRRALLSEILGRLPASQQAAVAAALQAFTAAAGEVPDGQWPGQQAQTSGGLPGQRGTDVAAGRGEQIEPGRQTVPAAQEGTPPTTEPAAKAHAGSAGRE
jgi:DNA-binding MarR family transcriptional regulator